MKSYRCHQTSQILYILRNSISAKMVSFEMDEKNYLCEKQQIAFAKYDLLKKFQHVYSTVNFL